MLVAGVARIVVIAHFMFTATTVIPLPVTGELLDQPVGYALSERRIAAAIALYRCTGFWLLVARPGNEF